MIVKNELICVNAEVKSDMWERKKGPLRKAQRMRIKKNKRKTRQKRKIRFAEASTTFL